LFSPAPRRSGGIRAGNGRREDADRLSCGVVSGVARNREVPS
jgi:hypothetical protein